MRPISWVKSALKEFEGFPRVVQERIRFALEVASAGEMPDIAKPLKGFDAGVFEVALAYRTDAFRAVYAVKLGDELWVLHAFQKKSKQGTKTPKHEIELVHQRIRRIREIMK